MRYLLASFLLLFSSSLFAATCSDIWPSAVSFPAPASPDTPAGLVYDSQITNSVTYSSSETQVAVDAVVFNGNRSITFEGSGTRVLYIRNALDIGGTSSINAAGNVDLVIVVGGAMNISGTASINGVVYVAGSSAASGSPTITGAVTSAGATTVTSSHVTYDAALVAAVATNSACEGGSTGLSYPYTTGFEGDNSEWDLAGDFSISNDTSGARAPRSGSYVLDNNSEDIDQRRRYSGHTAELNDFISIPSDATLPELSFFYKLDVFDSRDDFRVFVYSEASDSWALEFNVDEEQNNSDYRFASVDLSDYKGDRIKVRFQQYITSYTSGARTFLVDDLSIQDRPTVDFSYPYSNGFEGVEAEDWYVSGDIEVSSSAHNQWSANSGGGFLDNNPNEEIQRRHYNHHFAMMSGFVGIPVDADQPTVSFHYKIDVNDTNDRYFIEIQTSDSTSWTRLDTLHSEDDIGQYAKYDYYLADSYKGQKVRIRIRQYITSYNSSVRLFVMDDFRIGNKEVDSTLTYPYTNSFESVSEQTDWNARGDMNISTVAHDTDYVAYEGDAFIDNNPALENQRRHYKAHIIEMQKYVTLPDDDDVVLNFKYKLNALDSNDRFFIEIQRDGATNWSRIETLSEQHNHSSYTEYEASLAAYKNDTVRIRFRQYITSYTSGARLFVVDDFYVGPQQNRFFDFPYFNDFETDVSTVTINQDDTDDVNGRDQWNHEGDWDISGVADNSVDPERTAFSGDWYLNNNSAFNEDQRRHYINHEMSMAGYVLIPADATVPEASFMYRLDVIDANDRFFFEYQVQGSSNWSRIATLSLEQKHSTYTRYRYTLSDSLKGQYVRFRFRQYITSYTSGVRHFTVDDFKLAERSLETYDYPYFNDFETDVSDVTVDQDDSNDINGIDQWNHQGDWGISTAAHNAYEARSGSGFIDNNPAEENQRRHYSGHVIEMNGSVAVPAYAEEPELTFYYKMDVVDSNDRFFVEVQRNDSSSWTRLRTLNNEEEHDAYTKSTTSLSAYKGDSIRIRFRQYITSYTSGTRLFTVDDLRIGDKTYEYYDFPYFNGFEEESSDLANGINGRDQWNHEGDWYFNDVTHGDADQGIAKNGTWYLDSNRDDEDQRRKYSEQITEMVGYVRIPADAVQPVLSFDYKLDVIDSTRDDYFLEVQELGSSSWTRLKNFQGTEETSSYTKYVYELDSYAGRTIRVRFRTYITSYSSGPRYFTIDNFKLGYLTVGFWSFEGNLEDISGSGNDATAGGSDAISYSRSGVAFANGANSSCQYIDFTGNNYLSVADTASRELTDQYSVSAWVYPHADESTGNHYSSKKSIVSKDQNFDISLENGQVVWQWNDGANELTSASTLPLEQWTHVAVTFAQGEQIIYINGTADASSANSDAVSASSYPIYVATAANSSSGAVQSSRNFDGLIDEVRVYEVAQSQSEIDEDMQTVRECASLISHILIEHSGTGVACVDHSVTLKLCANSDCTDLYSGDNVFVTLQKDEAGTVTDLGTFEVDGSLGQYTDATFSDTSTATWDFTATAPDVTTALCANGGSDSCSYEVTSSGFIVTEVNNSGLATSCSATSFTIQAVQTVGVSPAVSCQPAYSSGNYPLNFEMNYVTPNAADVDVSEPASIGQTIGQTNNLVSHAGGVEGSAFSASFNADASADIAVEYAEAGEISITVRDNSGVLSEVTQNLQFVPAQLGLSWKSGESTKLAGANDSVVIVGQCSDGSITKNYEPSGVYDVSVTRSSPETSDISDAEANALENFTAEDEAVTVNGAASAVDISAEATTDELLVTYDEHADIAVSVSDTDYFGATINPDAALSASYRPSHYAASTAPGVFANTCSGFTYVGQSIAWETSPTITLTGQNVADETTNFSDFHNLFDTNAMAVAMAVNVYQEQTSNDNNSTVTGNDISVTVEDSTSFDGALTFAINDQTFNYVKSATASLPFESDITLSIPAGALMDVDGTGVKTSFTETEFAGVEIADNAGSQNYYGRLKVESASGSELDSVSWVAEVQYYDSVSNVAQWVVNSADTCSVLTESAFTIAGSNEFYLDDTVGYALDESDTGATTYLLFVDGTDSVTANGGYITLPFNAPEDIGLIEIDVNLSSEQDWLQFDWDNDGSLDVGMPTTNVLFGRYRGNDRIIFKRER